MSRYLKRAVIRSFAFVLAFAYAVENIVLADLLGKRLAGELLYVGLKRRNAEHLPARKPVADRSGRKALKETLLACEIHMNGYNERPRLRQHE